MLVREPRIQGPQLERYSDMPLFNTKAVVHQTGVPAPTLRAWERRYGILAPHRGENDYRLYSERDIAIVAWLHERIQGGLTISQAIALMRSLEPTRRRGRRMPVGDTLSHDATESREGRASGGQVARMATVPALPGRTLALDELSQTLLEHFIQFDEIAADGAIAQAFSIYTVEEVCSSLLTPTLARISELWQNGDITTSAEHFASALVRGRLESLFHSALVSDDGPMALVGCAPGDLHEIGAVMLALFLRRVGLRVVYLGQCVELEHLMTTIETVRPAALLLTATLRAHAAPLVTIGERLAALDADPPVFFFGGPAFSLAPDLAPQIHGVYIHTDAPDVALEIKRRLNA